MMLTPGGLSSAIALLLFLCAHSLPVPEGKASNRYKAAAGWLEKPHLYPDKKRGWPDHAQDTAKETLDMKGPPPGNGSEVWRRPRCGVPDYTAREVLEAAEKARAHGRGQRRRQRQRRFVLFGGRWDKTDLSYKIVRFPWQMSEDKVRRVLQEALRVWSDVTPLNFREVHGGRADIIIDFTRYWHGDSLPFDGPGGILAHAFFPKTHREGDIHFDYDETWTVGNSMGTDLLQVAAHEFGHVLGLQHSLEPGSVMSPFYSFSYPLELSDDDRRGIQYLYGPRKPPPPPPVVPETNEIPNIPDACRSDFDAVSMIRGELFFFRSRYVWRIRDGRLQAGYPALASRHWNGIPESIDAAFEDKAGNIWFFQGHSYWVYDGERRVTGPDPVSSLGLPVSNIQAALMGGRGKEQKTYFFKDGSYWQFDPLGNQVEDVQPHSLQDWWGVPRDIDAAFQDRYGYAHFLSGKQYWKVDPKEGGVLEGYPRSIGMDFFDCASSTY
ncbi:stromelysin-3-like isoform X2 [Paramormyrops kingsleyae]|uniref:stromelysin-3-like isoform X2 n=1 Tax=Paramormyrops kingsleyae TaxID=1676925 RepID=UPI000CD5E761|nr:stromelysin-3-like isoform X2 [Paramormyrops kingsleyae]